jgi:hypothetical protein
LKDKIDVELRKQLADLGVEPRGNDIVWRKNHHDIFCTREQVRLGTRRAQMGELFLLAKRDRIEGEDWKRGTEWLERQIADLTARLAELPPETDDDPSWRASPKNPNREVLVIE